MLLPVRSQQPYDNHVMETTVGEPRLTHRTLDLKTNLGNKIATGVIIAPVVRGQPVKTQLPERKIRQQRRGPKPDTDATGGLVHNNSDHTIPIDSRNPIKPA